MKKIIFLEGLPGVGKTTLVKTIREMNLKNVYTVNEIIKEDILNNISHDQNDFMKNDNMKYQKYNQGTIVIDRGFISTLSYNETMKKINNNHNIENIVSWFDSIKNIYQEKFVYTIFLTTNKKAYQISENDIGGPYGSIENQQILEDITLKNIKKYCRNYKIIEYHKQNMEEIINEIIN